MPRERYQRIIKNNNEHNADSVYVEAREIVLGSLPLRYVASLRHANRHDHNQHQSSQIDRFTLARRTFFPKSSSAYYFDSYGILPLIPDIEAFIRRNCTVWDYNKRQLQGLTSNIYGKYCCLFALYMDRWFTARQFVGQHEGSSSADRQIVRAFASQFGERGSSPPRRGYDCCGVQCSSCLLYKRWVLSRSFRHSQSCRPPIWRL